MFNYYDSFPIDTLSSLKDFECAEQESNEYFTIKEDTTSNDYDKCDDYTKWLRDNCPF